jgi:hypothetical protein
MGNLECPHCGGSLANGATVCGECGKELSEMESRETASQQEGKSGRKNAYAILAICLVVIGGVALLMFTGLLPNPIKGGSTAAIVNGVKISTAEVDQKVKVIEKMSGQGGKIDTSTTAGKAATTEMRRQILDSLIQEKILVTEAAKEKITVSPQEIAERIASVKKGMNLSDKDFEDFLKNHAMSSANLEERMGKDLLIAKLVEKGAQGKGLTQDAWFKELNARAKVEILAK